MTKRTSIPAVLLFLLGSMLYAADIGGLVHNETGFAAGGSETGGGPSFRQLDMLNIWFTTATENNVVFSAGGSYTFSYAAPSITHIVDIYDFQLKGRFLRADEAPNVFSFSLGRFESEDFTERLFSHSLDGFSFGFAYPAVRIHTDVGFAGFQFKQASTMQLSKLDYNDQDISSVILGPKRMVGLAEIAFTNLFQRQTLSISAIVQEDLRALFENENTDTLARVIPEGETAYTPERGGLVDTQYYLLGMNGPIAAGFYYDFFGGLSTGRSLSYIDGVYSYTPIIGVTAGFNLRYYNKDALYSRADLGLIFASGDPDSSLYFEGNTENRDTKFTPPSVIPTGRVFSPVLSNIFFIETSYGLKPLAFLSNRIGKNIETGIDALFFFRSTPTQISEGGLDPASNELYLGTEMDLSVDFRVLSDLGFSINAGWFFPSKSAFLPEKEAAWFVGKITASLSW